MRFLQFFGIAIKSISANKLRSALTMLGIIIGVGAVISLMSVGRGAQASVLATFEQMGTNVIFVQPVNPEAPGLTGLSRAYATPTLTLNDAEALSDIPAVSSVVPTSENFVEVIAGNKIVSVLIQGSTPAYKDAYAHSLSSGQFISDRNVTKMDTVVVLGSKVADELFGTEDPIGQEVKIKSRRFTVIGVLEPKGGAFLGISMDNVVVTPITTYQSRLFSERTASGEDSVQSIAVQVSSADEIDSTIDEIEAILSKRHRIAPDEKNDFAVISQEQVVGLLREVTSVFTIFLGAIAGISLIVGGIGIMNIMLVSVTERTREIGIRKAVGAKRRDILAQFLLEAGILSLVGGGIGIIGGVGVSRAVSLINIEGMKLTAVVSPDIVILAISVSIFVGLVSGIYPAIRAARLNPIEALRYE